MKKFFSRIGLYFWRIYRLALGPERQEMLLVNDLVKLHRDAGWRYGLFEQDKLLRTGFEVTDGVFRTFNYFVADQHFHCRVTVLEDFPEEYTEELFVLASHFNNLLNQGVVVVHTEDRSIEYQMKQNILVPLLNTGELYFQIRSHFNVFKDVYTGFHRLITEREAPAIIIADLLRSKEKDSSE